SDVCSSDLKRATVSLGESFLVMVVVFTGAGSLRAVNHAHGEPLQRSIVGVEQPSAEVGGAAAVDNGGAQDFRPLLERNALGDAIVDDSLAIAENADELLAVDPPYRSRVGTYSQAHVRHILRAVDSGDGPEQHVGSRLVQRPGEVVKVDVVKPGVHRVPCEFLAVDGHLVAILRNDGELVGEVLLLDARSNGAFREVVEGDRFQEDPALDETVGVRGLSWSRGSREAGRGSTSGRGRSRGGRGAATLSSGRGARLGRRGTASLAAGCAGNRQKRGASQYGGRPMKKKTGGDPRKTPFRH